MSVDLWDLAPTYEIFHPSASCGATRTLKVSEWSGLFYQRLVVDFPDLKFSNAPDEYENYSCTLQGKDLDLFVMGCDDCFMAVWFEVQFAITRKPKNVHQYVRQMLKTPLPTSRLYCEARRGVKGENDVGCLRQGNSDPSARVSGPHGNDARGLWAC